MRNNRLSLFVIVGTILIFLPLGYFLAQGHDLNVFSWLRDSDSLLENNFPKKKKSGFRVRKKSPQTIVSQVESPFKKQDDSQSVLLNKFQDTIKLNLDFPLSQNYILLDLEDGIAGIYGTSLNTDKHFVVLATHLKVNVKDILSYLAESKTAFPFINGHTFKPNKMFFVRSPSGSGLKDLTIIPTTNVKGQALWVAVAERKDTKGSYLFMMKAPAKYFVDNEEGLDQILNSMRTTL